MALKNISTDFILFLSMKMGLIKNSYEKKC
jgi:hypothetical protein